MKRNFRKVAWIFVPLAVLSASALAQDKNRVSNFIREALTTRSREIVANAGEMPADQFNFRLTPEGMTFGQFTLHVATANYLYCSRIGAVPEPKVPTFEGFEPKDKLIDRLKSSFDFCTAALARLDDSSKSETLQIGEAKTSRAMAILTLSGTWADHAGQQGDYLQAIGRAPAPVK